MAGDIPEIANPSEAPACGRLDSWKEIAAYLKRDVTTVRRWEKREGLPVHRHPHDRRDSVYAYTGELDRWLQGRAASGTANGTDVARHPRERLRWIVAATLFATVLVLGIALAIPSLPPAARERTRMRFSIASPAQTTFGTVTLSPNGRYIAFTATSSEGKRLLWVRPLDSLTAAPLAGTDDALYPFWSPDSRSIGFFAQGKLRTIEATGGALRIVCDAPSGRGGAWNPEGIIAFAPTAEGAIHRVQATGGQALPVTNLRRPGERGHLWPEFLSDGRRFLYLADSAQAEDHGVYVASLDAPQAKRLLSDATNVAYTSDGYLLFVRDRRLIAQRFDAGRLVLAGDPTTVADSVGEHFDAEHLFDFSISRNGILAHRPMPSLETRLVWRDRRNVAVPFAATQALYADPTLSPDGTRMVVGIFDPLPASRFGFWLGRWTSDLWLYDVATGARSRFTFDPAADFEGVWSPDSTRIAFASNRGGSLALFVQNTSGGAAELLLQTPNPVRPLSWSADGRHVLYASLDARTRFDVWMLPMIGDRRPVPLLRSEFNEHQAVLSPDGRWIAYTSSESGRNEVYVQSFPALDRKWQISAGGGGDARWRFDGRELFYIAQDRMLMSVPVQTGATFDPAAPRPLFDSGNQPGWAVARNHYDVSRDGERFLVMAPVDEGRWSSFTVVVNWTTLLGRDAPQR